MRLVTRSTFSLGLVFVGAAVLGFALTAHADRTDVLVASTLKPYAVNLKDDGTGNCLVTVCASVGSADGGTTFTDCAGPIQLTGASNTNCENFINGPARNLFIAAERL
jgi:hypothetical protein